MRKLKLQMQITADGFVAGPEGQGDWMVVAMDAKSRQFVNDLTDTSDTILAGRKMTEGGFLKHWEGVAENPESPMFEFAKKMVGMKKVVFSKTVSHIEGKNVRVENGDLVQAVNELKNQPGKDILVYGGASFVSALIENGLIDEFYLIVNPIAIGEGMRIFKGRTALKLVASAAFESGKVVNTYLPKLAD